MGSRGWSAAGSVCQAFPLHQLNLNIPGHGQIRQALTLQYLERFESIVTHSYKLSACFIVCCSEEEIIRIVRYSSTIWWVLFCWVFFERELDRK